jgi:ABC-2 type transport system permease protein
MNRRGSFLTVSMGIASRQVLRLRKNPALLVPSVMFPLILFAAFTGAVSAIAKIPNFGYPNYTAFMLVFVLMQGAVFAGVLVGISLADDFESGFAKRVMLAVPNRKAILFGYLLMAFLRTLVIAAILFIAGFIGGMFVRGSAIQLVALIVMMLLFSGAAAMFAAGVALRAQSTQAGPAMQLPMLVLMFLMPVYSPRALLNGWIHSVANVNPFTTIIEAGRGLLEAQPVSVWQAYAIVGGFLILGSLWALSGLRKAEQTGPRAGGGRTGRRRGRSGGGHGGRRHRGRARGSSPSPVS